MEGPDVRPHEPHLLLARPDDLFTVAKTDLQAEPIRHRTQDVGDRGQRVGAEERPSPHRLVHQDDPDHATGRPPGRQERLVPFGHPYTGDLSSRLRLSGDWWGSRSALADRGLTFDLFLTQFYQGIAAGGRRQAWEYGGKLDYLFNLDGAKAGLWKGFYTNLHAETRYGTDVNGIDGLLTPSNIAMNFPKAGKDITAITGLKFTQALSETSVVFLGKINTLDEYGFRYSPALGTNRPGLGGFLNTSLVFNPIVGRTVPYSAAGLGYAYLREGQPLFSFSVFDPQERATTGVANLFARGVVLVPDLTFNVKPYDRPGKYNFGGTYSSASYRSFDPAAYLNILPKLVLDERYAPKETGSWSLYANFYQSLWVDPEDQKRNWGVFGQFGISDGNPNPVRYVANGGIGGRSMIPGRTYDTFGVDYCPRSWDLKTLAFRRSLQ